VSAHARNSLFTPDVVLIGDGCSFFFPPTVLKLAGSQGISNLDSSLVAQFVLFAR
jgi:hypothetical protein